MNFLPAISLNCPRPQSLPLLAISHNKPPRSPVVGDLAPDVSFRRTDGSSLRLASLKGHVVVLEFTSLACLPCRALAPKLEALAGKNPSVLFLTICVDSQDAARELLRRRPKNAKTFFVQDLPQEDRSMMAIWQFGNPGFPSMFVVGRDGRMSSRLIMSEDNTSRLEFRIEWSQKRS